MKKYHYIIFIIILACFYCDGFSQNAISPLMHDSIVSLQRELNSARTLYEDAIVARNKAIVMLAASGGCICILAAGLYQIEKRAKEYSRWASDKNKSFAAHKQMLTKVDNESDLKKVLENQIRVIRELITVYNENSGNIKIFIRYFREKIRLNAPEEGFWADLRIFADINYNNVISRMEKEFSELTDKDLNFIMLTCCGFSYIEIALCLGYANANSISNRRIAIARKIGTKASLNNYLKQKISETRL